MSLRSPNIHHYETPKAQTFSEALQNYLCGSEWQQSIEIFVRANCDKVSPEIGI